MKKVCVGFISVICLVFFFSGTSKLTYADEFKKFDTEIGIEIEKADRIVVDSEKPKLIDGGSNHNNYQLLPKTGELLSSLIVVLIGISFLIFFVGVISIKRLYQLSVWEV